MNIQIKVENDFKPLVVEEYLCISYKKGEIFYHESIGETPRFLGKFPLKLWQKILISNRMTERFSRIEPRTSIKISDKKYLVSFCGAIYCIDVENKTIRREHVFRKGMANPLIFCEIKGMEGFDDCIVYGEYIWNTEKGMVSIYTRRNGAWEKSFSFNAGTICHIHSIVADATLNRVFILTGDSNEESGIWIAKNNFKEVYPILCGKQKFRSCVAFPMNQGLLYATDSPLESNQLLFASLSDNTWSVRAVFDLPGPVVYGLKLGSNYVFATTVEPDSNLPKLRYFFTQKLGKGLIDSYSHIIYGNMEDGFQELFTLKKDRYPMWLFQFGNVHFPVTDSCDQLIMYPISLSPFDGKTISIKVV